MVKLLYFDDSQYIHNKCKEGLNLLVANNHLEYVSTYEAADFLYFPSRFDNNIYKSIRNVNKNGVIILGAGFSVFPEQSYFSITPEEDDDKIFYTQPSQWVLNLWKDLGAYHIPLKILPFPVDTNKYKTLEIPKSKYFIYFKLREQYLLDNIVNILIQKGYNNCIIFDYTNGYDHDNYINVLQQSKFGIWIGRHESQGFGLEEALSCDVPLLILDAKRMDMEVGVTGYENIDSHSTTAPYFSEECGEKIENIEDFSSSFDLFVNKKYNPRQYIIENLNHENIYNNYWLPLLTQSKNKL